MKLSVIIPVLNEESALATLLPYLKEYGGNALCDLIVVDGGSRDKTKDVAETFGAQVVKAPKGRAVQMNAGAEQASGEVLYFVHADTCPPKTFAEDIQAAVKRGTDLGNFRVQWDGGPWMLHITSFFSRFRWIWCQGGDKTLFIRRELFEQYGGYDTQQVIMEEYKLVYDLKKNHRFEVLPRYVTASARKYARHSYWRVTWANGRAYRMWKEGRPAEEIQQFYQKWIT